MSIVDWSQTALKAVVEAKSETDFESAFDALFSQEATFVDNGVNKSRMDYMGELITTGVQFDSQTIKFEKFIEVSSEKGTQLGAVYELVGLQGSTTKSMQVVVNATIVKENGANKVTFLSQVATDH
ncbi:hypothetical protein BU17DRAFT_79851 [Hysterangium stoloniferum]|nr:hypothetical protein BU17DRAFT_79851 [Hysterangium stoloniferum]